MSRSLTPNLSAIYFVAAVGVAVALRLLSEDEASLLYAPCVVAAVALLVLHFWIVLPRPQGAVASLQVLLPVFYFAVHFSYQFCVLCGMRHFFDYDYIEGGAHYRATVLCLSGFLMLLSGLASSYGSVALPIPRLISAVWDEDRLNRTSGRIVAVCMVAMVASGFTSDFGSLLSMPYAHPDSMGVIGRFYDVVQKLFMIALLMFMATVRGGVGFRTYLIPAACAGLWFYFWSLVGLRGQTQVVLLGMVIAWSIRIRPLNRAIILVALVASLCSWIIIGQARHREIGKGDDLSEMLPEEGAAMIVTQLGQVVTTVDRAMMIHPEDEPFQHGFTYIGALRYALPNVTSGERAPLQGYAEWMSEFYGIRNTMGGTKGLGSSPLAEGYANFSAFGVLVLFMIGLIAGKLETRALVARDSAAVFYYSLYCVVMVWTMRNDSLSWGRWFVWGYVLWISAIRLSKHLPAPQRAGGEPSSYC